MGTGEMKILVTPVMAILSDAGEMAGGMAVLQERVKAHKTKNGTKQILHNLRIQPPRAAKHKSSEANIQREINALSHKYRIFYDQQHDNFTQMAKQIEKSPTVFKTSTELSAAVNAVPQSRVPVTEISPFIIWLDSPDTPTTAVPQPTVPVTEISPFIIWLDSPDTATTAVPQPREPATEMPCSPDIIRVEESMDISDNVKKELDRESGYEEYKEEIYAYLREAEMRNRACAGYMNIQKDFTSSMRCIMVDWIVEVSEELNLHRETLFLAVNYIDRYLSKMPVSRGTLQLVGAACLFLATKYEENRCRLRAKDFGNMTIEELINMEVSILDALAYNVAMPTPNRFCEDFVKSCDGDDKLKALSMFLCELTLIEMDTYLKYLPSITAAASLCLARYSLGLEPWTAGLAKTTGYEVEHFEDCLKDLHKTYLGAEAHQQQAVQEKYKQEKYHKVSDFNMNPVPNNLS